MTIKTRFAPSPTGDLHLGSARTALFAWLYAKRHGGIFVLRIEDTDIERSTEASVTGILETMSWLGMTADEGPYYQSQRTERYQALLDQLLAEGKAYRCDCSKERLERLRKEQFDAGHKPKYDGCCRDKGDSEVGSPNVIRFRQPHEGVTQFTDLVRGPIVVQNAELDDMVLARSDGSPTYNFTVVVDDGDMAITHVLRGDDHINNTPRQINLLQALGYPLPQYGHLSSILGPDGKRLSKRNGAKPVLAYRDQGIIPEAMLNCLCRLGWSHGDQEVFSLAEMQSLFDLDAVQKSAASFSDEKLIWLNQQHLQMMADNELVPLLQDWFAQSGISQDAIAAGPSLLAVAAMQKQRCKTLKEICQQSLFFYNDVTLSSESVGKALKPEASDILTALRASFAALPSWQPEAIHASMAELAEAHGVGFGKVGKPLRAALTGGIPSASIAEVADLLGKDKVLARIDQAIQWLQ